MNYKISSLIEWKGGEYQNTVEDYVTRRDSLYCFPDVFAVMKTRMVKPTNAWHA